MGRRDGTVCHLVRGSLSGLGALRPETKCLRHRLHSYSDIEGQTAGSMVSRQGVEFADSHRNDEEMLDAE